MSDNDGCPRRVHFGVFEVDLRAAELRKQGLKVKLHGQPFQVLAMLLERPGELVTREAIREKLWPQDTFIDFEHSVNSSIKRLREALGDDAATPRFIETLPRHGYRFIAPVETLSPGPTPNRRGNPEIVSVSQPPAPETGRRAGVGNDGVVPAGSLQSDTRVTPRVAPQAAGRLLNSHLLVGAGFLAVAAAVFLVFGHISKPGGGLQNSGKLRLFLSSEGNLSGPALAPDGKMVAYVNDEGGQELYVSRVAGGERVQLTHDHSGKDSPQFSPDSEKIAFVRYVSDATQSEICVIPTLGGVIAPLIPGALSPAWSPDGSKLAFVFRKQGKPDALVTSASDGSDVRVILQGDGVYPFLGRPSWSPDGTLLAVTRSQGGAKTEIWIVPAKGGGATRLTKDAPGQASNAPVFTPEGRGVVHSSNRGGAPNLWWQPLDAKPPIQLTTGPGPDTFPSVARDGTIAFLNSRSRNVLLLYSLLNNTTTTLLSDASRLWAPAFSPDGQQIAYSRDEPDGSWHLWLVPAIGGSARQLTAGNVPEIYPRFTPDGSEIIFNTWGAEPFRLWRIPSRGGPAKPLSPPGSGSDALVDVSPDGSSIVFTRTENKVTHLYVASANGSGEPRRLLNEPGDVPRWSPDGKWISFSPNRGYSSGVSIVHPDGTGLRRLTEHGGWAVWWPDGQQIGFQIVGPDGNTHIQVFKMKTGELQTIPGLHFLGTNFPFDISRDGKWLVTTNYQHVSDEIWLLEPADKK